MNCFYVWFSWTDSGLSMNHLSPEISRTLHSIPVDHNTAVIWMDWTWLPISNSPSSLNKPLGIVSSASVIIVITFTFDRSENLLLFSFALIFSRSLGSSKWRRRWFFYESNWLRNCYFGGKRFLKLIWILILQIFVASQILSSVKHLEIRRLIYKCKNTNRKFTASSIFKYSF